MNITHCLGLLAILLLPFTANAKEDISWIEVGKGNNMWDVYEGKSAHFVEKEGNSVGFLGEFMNRYYPGQYLGKKFTISNKTVVLDGSGNQIDLGQVTIPKYASVQIWGGLENKLDKIQIIEGKTPVAEQFYGHGIKLYKRNEYDASIGDFSRAIELDPEYVDAYYLRGRAYNDQNKGEQAISNFDKAITISANDYKLFLTRGVAYRGLTNYTKARDDFLKAIEIDAEMPHAYVNLGGMEIQNEKNEHGCQYLARACELGYCSYIEEWQKEDKCVAVTP